MKPKYASVNVNWAVKSLRNLYELTIFLFFSIIIISKTNGFQSPFESAGASHTTYLTKILSLQHFSVLTSVWDNNFQFLWVLWFLLLYAFSQKLINKWNFLHLPFLPLRVLKQFTFFLSSALDNILQFSKHIKYFRDSPIYLIQVISCCLLSQ